MSIPYANFNQAAGRPSWQKALPQYEKELADRLMNKAASTKDPADIEQWVVFAERHGASKAN